MQPFFSITLTKNRLIPYRRMPRRNCVNQFHLQTLEKLSDISLRSSSRLYRTITKINNHLEALQQGRKDVNLFQTGNRQYFEPGKFRCLPSSKYLHKKDFFCSCGRVNFCSKYLTLEPSTTEFSFHSICLGISVQNAV